jgi:hypothetical protein
VVTREGVDKLELSERFKIMGEQMHRQVRFFAATGFPRPAS